MKKSLMALGLSAALATISNAQAVGFINAPVTPGTGVAGYCSSTAAIATPMDVTILQTNTSNNISDMASVLRGGQQEQIAAQKNLLNQQLQTIIDELKKLEAAREVQKYKDQTMNANALDNCAQQDGAAAVAKGISDAKTFMQNATHAPKVAGSIDPVACNDPKHCTITFPSGDKATPAEIITPVSDVGEMERALANTPAQQWDAMTILDPAASDQDVNAAIAHMVAPLPRKGIPSAKVGTQPDGLNWTASAQVDQVETSLPINALAKVAEGYRPTIDAKTIQQYWQDQGMTGNIPTLTNGKVSTDGLFNAMAESWYNNPQFDKDIGTHDTTWLIKQQVYMLAAQLWARQRENELLERVVALDAAMVAKHASPLIDKANNARDNAVDQVVRGAQ